MHTVTRISAQRGTSLVEVLVVCCISAVLAGLAAPSMHELRQRRQVEAVAAQIETELQFARSAAVARHRSVHAAFAADEHGSCYVVHTGSKGDCTCSAAWATPRCEAGAESLANARYPVADRVEVSSNSSSVLFDAVKGTVTPTATITVRGAELHETRLVINVMGRIRSCTTRPDDPLASAC